MFKEERQNLIQNLLIENHKVDIASLSQQFNVKPVTVRRDLRELEIRGLAQRTHGGAINPDDLIHANILQLKIKTNTQKEEKKKIGKFAASLLKPGETVYIGAGTTTYWVANFLKGTKDITVVSNSLPLANLIAQVESINLILVGGYLRRKEFTFIGRFADRIFKDFHFSKIIIGFNGIHPDHGFTSDHPQEHMTDSFFYHATSNVIVVADHTKIGNIATHKTADIQSAKTIITTKMADSSMINRIRQKGVEVIQL